MEKIFEEIKQFIGLNKLFIFVVTASMALFIDGHKYKSLFESLLNLKTKELLSIAILIKNIEISKIIFYFVILFLSFLIHRSIVKFISIKNSKNTSIITSIENIISKFQFNDSNELSKRIEAKKYTEESYANEYSKILFLLKTSEIFFCIGFFLVVVSFYCGLLDFVIGSFFLLIGFYFIVKYQVQKLEIIPKYIASEVILNKSNINKAIGKYLN